ncbi:MAG: hypothetical protein QME94_15070 [Anaerolineae bacterium]|nr:hypothetical protein [Anaerolineae bacterium]
MGERSILDRHPARTTLRAVAMAGVAAVSVNLYLCLFSGALIDDAYITLQYARNLRDHGQWGFYAGHIANTATSPLNVALTALTAFLVPELPGAAILLATGEVLVAICFLLRISRDLFRSPHFGLFASVALLANPLIVSTLGLECILSLSLFIWALYLCLRQRGRLLAVILSLLTLARPDGILAAIAFITFYERAPSPRAASRRTVFLYYLLCLVPWYAFSWRFLGSAFPDTLLIKLTQPPWDTWTFRNGPFLYLRKFPLETLASVAFLPAAPLAWRDPSTRRIACLIAAFGCLHYPTYSAMNVPPYHWYYAPTVAGLALLGALGLASLRQVHPRLGLAAIVPLACMAVIVAHLGLPVREMPIHTNWATPEQYRQIAGWIRQSTPPGATIRVHAEIGTLAFYSGRPLLDSFSCRAELRPILTDTLSAGGPAAFLLALNYANLPDLAPCGPSDYLLWGFPSISEVHDVPGSWVKDWRIGTRYEPSGLVVLTSTDANLQGTAANRTVR